MSAIETDHDSASTVSQNARGSDAVAGWVSRCQSHMAAMGAHPARTLVLLPYAQLLPVARRMWANLSAPGFAPRFETTTTWARSLGGVELSGTDPHFDAGLDTLTAQVLLERSGLAPHATSAAPLLLDCAYELAPIAAAQPVAARSAWARQLSDPLVFPGAALSVEAGVAHTALAWLGHSAFLTDVLFGAGAKQGVDAIIAVQGYSPDPVVGALQAQWGERMVVRPLDTGAEEAFGQLCCHAARDAADEALRAAARVIEHINAGHTPVALVALDRTLTRRVRAMLAGAGVALRDETGWKLSTSRSAAQVMAALRACAWNASTDAVLDWLKASPGFDAKSVSALEARLRTEGLGDWRQVPAAFERASEPGLNPLLESVRQAREALQSSRTLTAWCDALRELLQRSGQWQHLQQDSAGRRVLAALRLDDSAQAVFPADALWATRRMALTDCVRWVDLCLESASFAPEHAEQEQVVILPLAQLLGRQFSAVVVAGCDEQRLPASPEPGGLWSAGQRALLGLPAREALAQELAAAWRRALTTSHVDLLWRCSDDSGEPLQASSLVLALAPQQKAATRHPCVVRSLTPAGQARPTPRAAALRVSRLSASAYGDLRHCPYRFFALRMLGLKEADELEGEPDKRDYGLWLHAVLQAFHVRLAAAPGADAVLRRQWLDEEAHRIAQEQRLAPEAFLPFQAAWPRVREGYLKWLAQHEQAGFRFRFGEKWCEQGLGDVTLIGKLDRVDALGAGDMAELMVMDYKTESAGVTRERVKNPLEDTQMPFYAALLPDATLRAAYVNVGEGEEGTRTHEVADIVATRDELVQGVMHDMQRIGEGAALPALGDGDACAFCAARGLCRRDFWVSEVTK